MDASAARGVRGERVVVDAGVAPLWVALWRCFFGALALLAVCAFQRTALPRDPATWGHAAVVAALWTPCRLLSSPMASST